MVPTPDDVLVAEYREELLLEENPEVEDVAEKVWDTLRDARLNQTVSVHDVLAHVQQDSRRYAPEVYIQLLKKFQVKELKQTARHLGVDASKFHQTCGESTVLTPNSPQTGSPCCGDC